MALVAGRCKNFGGCHYADDRKVVEADDGAFVCPGCGAPLTPETPHGATTPRRRGRRNLLIGASLALAAVASGVGWRMWCCRNPGSHGPSFDEWISGDPPAPELESVRRGLAERASRIAALKAAGKALGTEHGLLDPVSGVGLLPDDLALLDAENRDRRDLYAYVTAHVDPPVTYERAANAFAMRRWREWPRR